tara:strand:- start:198 stop:389 length:192 start_codon:yes stop_codon:yes gene_type:complete
MRELLADKEEYNESLSKFESDYEDLVERVESLYLDGLSLDLFESTKELGAYLDCLKNARNSLV